MNMTHDYIHHYRGYWSDEGRCRIRIYQEEGQASVVICSQLPDSNNTSVTNIAEYLAAEVEGAREKLATLCSAPVSGENLLVKYDPSYASFVVERYD